MKEYRDIIILVMFAVVAGGALSAVYGVTREKIVVTEKLERTNALKTVLPTLSSGAKEVVLEKDGLQIPVTLDSANGAFSGAVLELETKKGYGGTIKYMVGVDKDRHVTGLYILSQNETPGLGTKAKEKTWWGQFLGKGQDNFKFKVKKDGGDADAITAATITSRAVTNQMDLGLNALAAHLEKR